MHPKSGPRRHHSDELKAKVLAACNEPGASISGIALAHGLNANLVRKWRCGRGAKRSGMEVMLAAVNRAPRAPIAVAPEFVGLQMPAPPKTAVLAAASAPSAQALIQIELRRGPLQLNVRWPSATAEDCRAWLSELSSGLLK